MVYKSITWEAQVSKEFLLNKTLEDLIRQKVFIKKIELNVSLFWDNNSLFPKFYKKHLEFEFFILDILTHIQNYTYGKDACGHAINGRDEHTTVIYPYFNYYYTINDDGYYVSFSITTSEIREKYLNSDKYKTNAPSILELALELVTNHFESVKKITFSSNESINMHEYLSLMHPKDKKNYENLGVHSFLNFQEALEFSKNNAPSVIKVDKEYYFVEYSIPKEKKKWGL